MGRTYTNMHVYARKAGYRGPLASNVTHVEHQRLLQQFQHRYTHLRLRECITKGLGGDLATGRE